MTNVASINEKGLGIGTYDEADSGVVRAFSDWVNVIGHDNDAFAQLMMKEHRTLQQCMFETMLACMDAWARSEHYDARNEFAVVKSREIMSLFPGGPRVPFV